MTSQDVKLSFGEKLGMFGILGFTLLRVAFTALRHLIIPPSDSPGPARVAYGMLFRNSSLLSSRQQRALPSPPTAQVIAEHCATFKIPLEVEELPAGGKLHWVGPKPVKGQKVLFYVHGGGYNRPATPGHVIFPIKCAMSQFASLVMLEYTLAPQAHYPIQSHQAIEALKHILEVVPASSITIAGDSAGAHLTLCILAHINHPLPDVKPIVLREKLGGICLICPFLSFDMEKQSYIFNKDRDILTRKAVEDFNATFKPPGVSDQDASLNPRLSPLDSPAGWFKGSPVRRILLTMGDREIFVDDIVAFNEKLEAEVSPGTVYEFFVGRKEAHAAPLIDASFGLSECESAKAIVYWMSQGV